MARPKKNNAEYFSHDSDMRNNLKIKAIRNRFGLNGYAVWCMLLECLTDREGNSMPGDEIFLELLAGDFGVEYCDLKTILEYCVKLELLSRNNGLITSNSLNKRLAPLYEKRARDNSFRRRKCNEKDVIDVENTETIELSTSKTPQSKVKESKEKEREINLSKKTDTRTLISGANFGEVLDVDLPKCFRSISTDQIWIDAFCMNNRIRPPEFAAALQLFFVELQNRGDTKKTPKDAKHHFASWYKLNKNKSNEINRKPDKQGKIGRIANEFAEITSGGKPFTGGATLPDL